MGGGGLCRAPGAESLQAGSKDLSQPDGQGEQRDTTPREELSLPRASTRHIPCSSPSEPFKAEACPAREGLMQPHFWGILGMLTARAPGRG